MEEKVITVGDLDKGSSEIGLVAGDHHHDNKLLEDEEEDEELVLPGFRFHPTDEELVGFYLRRKVDNKPLSIEIIKQIEIYKYDPWDLPKASTLGDKEWYFFCLRGRKYRNSIRPNRVTGSGFWKATGIDRPIYSTADSADCIGLKKSLVYYRGSAGKGTKTDWMMHEFRLPLNNSKNDEGLQEAEVWTICRIFKRMATHKKYRPQQCKASSSNQQAQSDTSSKTSSFESYNGEEYRCYANPYLLQQQQGHHRNIAPSAAADYYSQEKNQYLMNACHWSQTTQATPISVLQHANYPHLPNYSNQFISNDGNWDELERITNFASNQLHHDQHYRYF